MAGHFAGRDLPEALGIGSPVERAVVMLMERVGRLEDRLAASEKKAGLLGDLVSMQANGRAWAEAQKAGRLDILDLLAERSDGWAMKEARNFWPATAAGRTDVLRWGDARCILQFDPGMYYHMAVAGDVEGLEWLRDRGCPASPSACAAAAVFGRTAAIRHLLAREPPFPWCPDDAFECACVKGHLETAQLVYSEAARLGRPIGPHHMRAVLAKLNGEHPEVSRWIDGHL